MGHSQRVNRTNAILIFSSHFKFGSLSILYSYILFYNLHKNKMLWWNDESVKNWFSVRMPKSDSCSLLVLENFTYAAGCRTVLRVWIVTEHWFLGNVFVLRGTRDVAISTHSFILSDERRNISCSSVIEINLSASICLWLIYWMFISCTFIVKSQIISNKKYTT